MTNDPHQPAPDDHGMVSVAAAAKDVTALVQSVPSRRRYAGPICLLMLFLCFMGVASAVLSVLLPGPSTKKQTLILPRDMGVRGIGMLLADNGVIYHSWQFILLAKLLAPSALKTGEYEFPAHISVLDTIALLRSGKTVVRKLVVPEGLTNVEIINLLQEEPLLTDAVADVPPEGRLFPATYHFSAGDSRGQLLRQMQKHADEMLQELWAARATGLPLKTPEEALTLASIVEKETGIAEERARIAGVFINRLRQGMRLQSDPTVIYAVTSGKNPLKRALTGADLAFPSPYNTYATEGLPPTPIANPGRAALQAVLNPEKHDYLYFVADGSGGHAFAKTLAQHNQNVSHWRRLSRK